MVKQLSLSSNLANFTNLNLGRQSEPTVVNLINTGNESCIVSDVEPNPTINNIVYEAAELSLPITLPKADLTNTTTTTLDGNASVMVFDESRDLLFCGDDGGIIRVYNLDSEGIPTYVSSTSAPNQVLSLCVTDNHLYAGLSNSICWFSINIDNTLYFINEIDVSIFDDPVITSLNYSFGLLWAGSAGEAASADNGYWNFSINSQGRPIPNFRYSGTSFSCFAPDEEHNVMYTARRSDGLASYSVSTEGVLTFVDEQSTTGESCNQCVLHKGYIFTGETNETSGDSFVKLYSADLDGDSITTEDTITIAGSSTEVQRSISSDGNFVAVSDNALGTHLLSLDETLIEILELDTYTGPHNSFDCALVHSNVLEIEGVHVLFTHNLSECQQPISVTAEVISDPDSTDMFGTCTVHTEIGDYSFGLSAEMLNLAGCRLINQSLHTQSRLLEQYKTLIEVPPPEEPAEFSFLATFRVSGYGDSVQLPLTSGYTYDFVVDWGDGTTDTITSYNQTETLHYYAVTDDIQIPVTGTMPYWDFHNISASAGKIISIDQAGAKFLDGVTDCSFMFANCTNFVGGYGLSVLDVSNITLMNGMFYSAMSFNQDISGWNVSSVTSMDYMFQITPFNQDIGSWDVSNVSSMNCMFAGAESFNQDISGWNVSNVTDMGVMFADALLFNQDLSSWNISNVTNMSNMFDNITLSTEKYDAMLIAWSALSLQPSVTFDAGGSKYSAGAAATARANIISTYGWTINDGGQV